MICLKCGRELAEGARFCSNCGAQVEPSAQKLFCPACGLELPSGSSSCPVCGAAVGQSPACEGTEMETISPASATNESDSLIAAMQTAARTSPENDASNAPEPKKPVPVPEYSPLSGSASSPDFASFGSTLGNYGAIAAAQVSPAPKRRSVVGIVITAAAVVIVAVLVIIFAFNRGALMNLFMGDAGYAAALESNGLNSISAAVTPAAAAQIENAVNAYAIEKNAEISYDYGDDELFNAEDIISYLQSALISSYGKNSADITISGDISVTHTTRSFLTDGFMDEETLDAILSILNETTLTMSATARDDAAAVDERLSDGSLDFGVREVIASDGSIYIIPPYDSKAIRYALTHSDSSDPVVSPTLDIDESEVSRLIDEIIDIYLKYYKASEITVEDGEMVIAGTTAQGRLITVTMNGADAADMLKEILANIAEDEYFCAAITEYMQESGFDFDEDDYREMMGGSSLSYPNSDDSLIISTVADKNGSVIAKSYAVTSSDSSASLEMINSSSFAAVQICEDGEKLLTVNIDKASATDGTANIKLYDDSSVAAAFKIAYSNVGTAKLGNADVITGEYVLTFTPASDFTQSADEYGTVLSVLSTARLTVKSDVSGDICYCSVSIELPQYLTAAIDTTLSVYDSDDSLIPADFVDITDLLNDSDEYAYSDEGKAVSEELISICENVRSSVCETDSELSDALDELLESLADSIGSLCEPAADYDDVYELIDDCYDGYYELTDLYNSCYDILDDDTARQLSELSLEYESIINACYDDPTVTEYKELLALKKQLDDELDALSDKIDDLLSELTAAADYGSMDFETLGYALDDLVDKLYSVIVTGYDAIMESDELYEMCEDVLSMYDDIAGDYSALISSSGGSLSLPQLRSLRADAEEFDKAITDFEKAVSLYCSQAA